MKHQVSMEAEILGWDHGVRIRRVKLDLTTKLASGDGQSVTGSTALGQLRGWPALRNEICGWGELPQGGAYRWKNLGPGSGNGQIRTSLQIKSRTVHPGGERTTNKWCCWGQSGSCFRMRSAMWRATKRLSAMRTQVLKDFNKSNFSAGVGGMQRTENWGVNPKWK